MRKHFILLLSLFLLCTACSSEKPTELHDAQANLVDAFGHSTQLPVNARVVSCYASYAECWLLAGGTLAGVTEDAVSEHHLEVGDAAIIGTVKHIDLETLVALQPDYVILSADLAAHLALQDSLTALRIPHGYFRVDNFDGYQHLMAQFCAVTGRNDLYQSHVEDVAQEILSIKEKIPKENATVLLLRVYSTGMRAKALDNLAGQILQDMGLINIASGNMLLEDLSLEHIVQADPDFIFALTMGNEAEAQSYLSHHVLSNPAWNSLTAVQENRYYLLPKELFHYKPNHRWGESYAYLARCIWPEIFNEQQSE